MSKRPVYGALQVYMLLRVPMYSVAMSRGLELLNGSIKNCLCREHIQ